MTYPKMISTMRAAASWPGLPSWAAEWYRRNSASPHGVTIRTLLSVVDQAAVSGAAFASAVVIGRACPVAELGLYALGLSVVLLVTQVQSALISAPYIVHLPSRSPASRRVYTGSALVHSVGLSALTMLGLTLAGVACSRVGVHGLGTVLRVLTVALPAILLRDWVRSTSFANLRFGRACVFDAGVGTAQVVALFALGRLGLLDAARAYAVTGSVAGLAAVVALFYTRREYRVDLRQAILDGKVAWSFGKWVLGDYATLVAVGQLYPWFLVSRVGPEAAAVFAACMGTAGLANPIVLGFGNLLGPTMARARRAGIPELKVSISKTSRAIALAGAAFTLLSAIGGGAFVGLLFGGRYSEQGTTVTLLTVSVFLLSASAPAGYGLWALRRADLNMKSNLLGLMVTVGIGPFMVGAGGVPGAAAALVLANGAGAVARAIATQHAMRRVSMQAT